MTTLTKADLHTLHALLDEGPFNLIAAFGRIDSPSRDELRSKLARMIAEASAVRQRGDLVFSWRLPLSVERYGTKGKSAGKLITFQLAPTLNVYAQQEAWQRKRTSKELDSRIMAELSKWPKWRHEGKPRAVRVTRFSSHEIDEATIDCAGGKMPIDRLVIAGVLRGDAPADLQREACWEKASPGKGGLLVEVFSLE